MVQFTANKNRFDPYKNFKFRLKWDGLYVAGVSKVSALKRTTETVKHRDGGDPSTSRKSPGRTEYEAITIERGVTHDVAFEQRAERRFTLERPPVELEEQALVRPQARIGDVLPESARGFAHRLAGLVQNRAENLALALLDGAHNCHPEAVL